MSPAIVSTNLTSAAPATSTLKNEELKTSSSYAVTENIIDIPDNRTLPPILTNFTFARPLNFGNNTLLTNNNAANNSEEKGDENNNNHVDGKLKTNSFSILHIKGEFESHKPETEHKHRNVLTKLFVNLKEHVNSWKRGVVDGLHSFFHGHDDEDDDRYKPYKPVTESRYPNHHNHHKFHRKFHDVEDFGHHSDYDDDYSDSSEEHYGHF